MENLLLILIISIGLLIHLFRWKIRGLMLKKLAKDLGLQFTKSKDLYSLDGMFDNFNINITEEIAFVRAPSEAFGNPHNLKITQNKLHIKVNSKTIYEYTDYILLPLIFKIKKLIINEIKLLRV